MKNKQIWMILKQSLLIGVVVIVTLLIFSKAYATHSYVKVNTIPQYGFLGGVTAFAEMRAIRTPEGPNGSCYIKSYTNPATTINIIGWTWWQCDVLDAGGNRLWGSGSLPPSAHPPASSRDSLYIIFFAGGTKIKTHGNHDFNHNGSQPSPWRPGNQAVWQWNH